MLCKYPVFLLSAVVAALSHSSLAALPDDAIKFREQNALHFLLKVKESALTKLPTPNGNGNAECHIKGKILELYASGNSNPTTQSALATQFAMGSDVQFDVACSDANYPVAPGGFGLSKSEIEAPRLEFWGEVEHSRGTDTLSFHPFKVVIK